MSQPVLVKCPQCQFEGQLMDPALLGQWIACPACQQPFQAPSPTPADIPESLAPPAVVPAEGTAWPTDAPPPPVCAAELGSPATAALEPPAAHVDSPQPLIADPTALAGPPLDFATAAPELPAGTGLITPFSGDPGATGAVPPTLPAVPELAVAVTCPHCQATGTLTEAALLGQWIGCPACQQSFLSPALEQVAPSDPVVLSPVPVPSPAVESPQAFLPPRDLPASAPHSTPESLAPAPPPLVTMNGSAAVPGLPDPIAVSITCPQCGAMGTLTDPALFGQWIACPGCRQTFQAPSPQSVPSAGLDAPVVASAGEPMSFPQFGADSPTTRVARAPEPKLSRRQMAMAGAAVAALLVISIIMFAMGDPVRRMTKPPPKAAVATESSDSDGPQESIQDVFARINAANSEKEKK